MLTEWASWRWVMFVNVPIGLAVIVVGASVLPETARQRGRFDLPGALSSTLGMAALVYGFVRAASAAGAIRHRRSFVAGRRPARGVRARRAARDSPITPLAAVRRPQPEPAPTSLAGCCSPGMFGMFFFLTQFLQDVLGYSPLKTGFAFLPLTADGLRVVAAHQQVLVDRIGGKALMLVGIAFGARAAAARPSSAQALQLLADPRLACCSSGRQRPGVRAADLGRARPGRPGGRRAASGLVNVTQQLGGTLGVAILVTVFGSASKYAASHPVSGANPLAQLNHVFVYGADHAFVASTLFLVAALVLIAAVVRAPKPTP